MELTSNQAEEALTMTKALIVQAMNMELYGEAATIASSLMAVNNVVQETKAQGA